MLPRIGDVREIDTGIDNVEDDTTDSWESGLQHANEIYHRWNPVK